MGLTCLLSYRIILFFHAFCFCFPDYLLFLLFSRGLVLHLFKKCNFIFTEGAMLQCFSTVMKWVNIAQLIDLGRIKALTISRYWTTSIEISLTRQVALPGFKIIFLYSVISILYHHMLSHIHCAAIVVQTLTSFFNVVLLLCFPWCHTKHCWTIDKKGAVLFSGL